jgi:hypothetical protein
VPVVPVVAPDRSAVLFGSVRLSELVALVLLFAGETTPAEQALLSRYELARSAELAPPTRDATRPPSPYPSYGAGLVARLEAELDEARTLGSSLDEAGALALLDRIEDELLKHPELPQAAWLLAERHRATAKIRERSPEGAADAATLWRAAALLEGKRALTFGEPASVATSDTPRTKVRVRGLDPRDRLELDGRSGPHEVELADGRHHVRVLRGDELVYAAFFEWPSTNGELDFGIPALVPCSADDLRGVEGAHGFAPVVPAGIACRRWVVVRRSPRGLELSECAYERCKSFNVLAAPPPKRPESAREREFPTWATVALASLGAIGTGSLVLWGAGVFDRRAQAPVTRFVYEGPKMDQ